MGVSEFFHQDLEYEFLKLSLGVPLTLSKHQRMQRKVILNIMLFGN